MKKTSTPGKNISGSPLNEDDAENFFDIIDEDEKKLHENLYKKWQAEQRKKN